MSIGLGFIMTNDLLVPRVWSNWLQMASLKELNVDCVCHMSRCSNPAFFKWAEQNGVTLLPEHDTEWAGKGIIEAHVAIYTHLLKTSPCSYMIILTQDMIPLIGPESLMRFIDTLRGRSA
jgi:hypothetical protein